jgi:hypothetical protein
MFPSILFWSSILHKDPLVLFGIAVCVYGVVGFYRFRGLKYLILIFAGIFIAAFIRIWLGPILLMPLGIFALNGIRGLVQKILFMVIIAVGFIFSWNLFAGDFILSYRIDTMDELLKVIESTAQGFETQRGGSSIMIERDLTSFSGLLAFLPKGMFTVLFRPLPGEVLNPFGILAGLENLLLLFLVLLTITRARLKDLKDPLILWAITLILVWSAAYGFTAFNLGTVVRFKLQILPLLLGVLMYLGRRRGRMLSSSDRKGLQGAEEGL